MSLVLTESTYVAGVRLTRRLRRVLDENTDGRRCPGSATKTGTAAMIRDHPERMAVRGLISDDLIAGPQHATSDVPTTVAMAPANVHRSVGVTS
jgi:hypothetical protein